MDKDNLRQAVLYAYLAGIIDGEGSIGINRVVLKTKNPRYNSRIGLGMVDRSAIDVFRSVFGGSVYQERVGQNRKNQPLRPIWRWYRVGNTEVPKILTSLLPYLRVKKMQAKLVVRFCRKLEAPTARRLGISGDQLRMREDFYQKVKKLNAFGAAATTKREDTGNSEAIV